jgi:hypothetical protein
LFPTHDYPFCLAQSCLELAKLTGEAIIKEALERWVAFIRSQLPANAGRGAYAEHYGRCINFLWGAGQVLLDQSVTGLAHVVAQEAVEQLYLGDMFRSHPGETRCDAVDGIGYLFLAFIALETDQEPAMMGFGF